MTSEELTAVVFTQISMPLIKLFNNNVSTMLGISVL
jgi:hypothetical protein